MRARIPFHLLLGVTAAFAIVIVAGLAWNMIEGAEVVRARLDRIEWMLAGWRWVLIAVVVFGWRYWVSWLGGHLPHEAQRRLVDARWRVAGWLVILEILLGQNLLGHTVELML
ncbi:MULTISPECIES: hypothetical protein [unclassified Thioalkalivibrio]|uniref:hypothetical protein n=1 Tax=unclassified Thioalkalivibrio TaxID=2621013 RepID=UPI00037CC370|nr:MULTISPECIES: hypothetical protein [unclassified Thioalkalivibrio]